MNIVIRSPYLVTPEHDRERLARNIYLPKAFHAFLALRLFLQEFLFTGYIATVQIAGDVFAVGADGFAGDEFAADRRL